LDPDSEQACRALRCARPRRDRDRAVEVITSAYTEGRLTKDEHDARVSGP
jgi:hypothetical protein